jgi:hypothetical protein
LELVRRAATSPEPGRVSLGDKFEELSVKPTSHERIVDESLSRGMALRMEIDFQAARRQIERLDAVPASTRSRALAAYVGAFDLADENGVVDVSSQHIANEFAISRMSWLSYRSVLEAAGLIEVHRAGRGARQSFRLHAPRTH